MFVLKKFQIKFYQQTKYILLKFKKKTKRVKKFPFLAFNDIVLRNRFNIIIIQIVIIYWKEKIYKWFNNSHTENCVNSKKREMDTWDRFCDSNKHSYIHIYIYRYIHTEKVCA